jgi:shikimate dehydrogenase
MSSGTGTRLIALLGDPVDHSLSARFQNAAIAAAGIDAVYVALRCETGAFEGLMRGIAAAGGAGNVTRPHKERATLLLDTATAAVERTGACNTFWLEDGRIHGDNTDVEGFDAAARQLIGAPAGARVLVLGAGGAARAAVLALLQGRADAIHLLARTAARARAVRDGLDRSGRRVAVLEHPEPLRREGYDLVVNATSLGLRPDDELPLDLDRPGRVGAVLDLAYGDRPTLWVQDARARGIPAADGLSMLIHQGAAAFRRWFGSEPDLEVMRRHALPDPGWDRS